MSPRVGAAGYTAAVNGREAMHERQSQIHPTIAGRGTQRPGRTRRLLPVGGALRLQRRHRQSLTLLVPGHTDRFLLAPFGMHWSEVKASDFMVVDFSGRVVSGQGSVEDYGALHTSAGAPPVAAGRVRAAHPHAVCDGALHAGESAPGNGGADRDWLL